MKFNPHPSFRHRLKQSAAAVVEQLEGRKLLAGNPLYTEPFDEANGATTGLLNGPSASGQQWRTYQPNGGIAVNAEKLRVQNTGGFVSWYTAPLNIAGQGPVDLSIDLAGTNIGPNDLARFIYSVDGGPQQQFAFTRGSSGNLTATATGITGNTLKVEVQLQALQGQYTLDNFAVNTAGVGADQVTARILNGTLQVRGTEGDDQITVTTGDFENGPFEVFDGDDLIGSFAKSDFQRLDLDVLGGADNVEVFVGMSTDTQSRGLGNVRVAGGAGNDSLIVNANREGDEFSGVFGGDGDDFIRVMGLRNAGAYGGAGNDEIVAIQLAGNLFGGEGNDTLTTSFLFNDLFGEGGNDTLNGGAGIADGGVGDDTINVSYSFFDADASSGSIDVRGGDGNDVIVVNSNEAPTVIRGGAGDDDIRISASTFSTGFVPQVFGEAGDDLIRTISTSPSDQISVSGGLGDDTLISGRGADDFSGGPGTDTVDYRGRTDGPFTVSFDNVANDGAEGEMDNIRDDVEIALGATIVGQPSTTLFAEPFDEANGANSGSLTGGGQWKTYLGAGSAPALQQRLRVADGKLSATNTNGFVSWYTSPLDISGQGPVSISLDLTGTNIGPNDLARFLYTVDGGTPQQFAFTRGSSGSLTAAATGITGNSLKVEVQFQALQGQYFIDNFAVTAAGSVPAEQVELEVIDGILVITGTNGDDEIAVDYTIADGMPALEVFVDGVSRGLFGSTEVVADLLAGNDRYTDISGLPNSATSTVFGGDGNDTITGGERGGEFYGQGGDDNINAGLGGGFLDGGIGDDTLRGGSEDASTLLGGAGDDTLIAAAGRAEGGAGNDTFEFFSLNFGGTSVLADGGAGDDVFGPSVIEQGSVTLRGGDGNDLFNPITSDVATVSVTAQGGAGNDTLISGPGPDDFSGGPGTDTVDYRGRTDGPFTVTFDNIANDGAAGENDNIRSDVKVALGVEDNTADTQPVYFEIFSLNNGDTSGPLTSGGGTWQTFRGGLGSGSFEVLEDPVGVLRARGTSSFVSFYTSQLNISTLDSVGVSIEVDAANLGPDDLVRAIYFVDGGPAQQFGFIRGNSGNGRQTFTAAGITGDRIKVEVQLQARQGVVSLDNFEINTPTDTPPPSDNLLTGETFDEADGMIEGLFSGAGRWQTFRGGPNFSVQDGVFRATNTGGFRSWYTDRFDISGGAVNLALDLASAGALTNSDRINVLVRVDGGAAQTVASFRGGVPDDFVATLNGLSGQTLQIEIQANVAVGSYSWDNIRVTRA